MIDMRELPISDDVRAFVQDYTSEALSDDAACADFPRDYNELGERVTNVWDIAVMRALQLAVDVIYGDGIWFNGESITPGLEWEEGLDTHCVGIMRAYMQGAVDNMVALHAHQAPNRLFP